MSAVKMYGIFEDGEYHQECGVMETKERAEIWLRTVTENEPERCKASKVKEVYVVPVDECSARPLKLQSEKLDTKSVTVVSFITEDPND